MPYSDPIVEELREMRNAITARFNYDVEKILDYYMKRQEDDDQVVYTDRARAMTPDTLETDKEQD